MVLLTSELGDKGKQPATELHNFDFKMDAPEMPKHSTQKVPAQPG
jgi:hypothetical protein